MASGGMVLSGDDVSALSGENIELLKKLLPPTNVQAEFDDTTFTVGRAKISEDKTIIYIFNFENDYREITVSIDKKASVYDLFEGKSLGIANNQIHFDSFPPHGAKVLILT